MLQVVDFASKQAQNFIRMEDLLAAMDGGTYDMQNQLCYCCTFIIQCNVCLSLFRSLEKFFIHKEEICASSEHHTKGSVDLAVSDKFFTEPQQTASEQYQRSDNAADVFLETVTSSRTPVDDNNTCLDLRFIPENKISEGFAQVQENFETKKEYADLSEESLPVQATSTIDLDDTPFIASLVECELCSELFQSEVERIEHMNTECPNANIPPVDSLQYRRKYVEMELDVASEPPVSPKRRKTAYEEDDDFEIQPKVKQKAERKPADLYCEICHRHFKSAGAATKHRNKVHKDGEVFYKPSVNSFECSECFKNYATEKNLERHRAFVHGLTSSLAIPEKTSTQVKSFLSGRKENKELDLNDQENTFPYTDIESNNPKPVKKQTLNDITSTASRISDEELLIYYDHDTKQCLVCCGHFDSLRAIRNHIKYAHAEHVSSEDIVLESHSNRLQNEVASFPEEVPSTLPDTFSSKTNFSADRNYVCSLCGKHFYVLQEYESHIALPHKIAIKS